MAVADALTVNTTLQELNISANRLNVNVVNKFAKLLTVTESLQVLQVTVETFTQVLVSPRSSPHTAAHTEKEPAYVTDFKFLRHKERN